MKVVQINCLFGTGSTGKICLAISNLLTQHGIENFVLHAFRGKKRPCGIQYMTLPEIKYQAIKAKIIGNYGFQSKSGTKRLIKELERISPDIVHLHNVHSHNVHLEMLFSYLKAKKIKTFWTFHDCWAITGYCPHYDMIGCEKWKNNNCKECPQRAQYSYFFDKAEELYKKKRQLLTDMDLTIITPSQWLANEVRQSFLKNTPVHVINNGIDLKVFSRRKSNFREIHQIGDKFLLLGVSFGWGEKKGLDVFIRMASRLDPEKFKIVLVGTDKKTDVLLPQNMISIHRTADQTELAEIYSAADLFVNPTREENFPTVNMEALACGTPVITFRTGGSPETIDDNTGVVVDRDDETALYQAILKIEKERTFSLECCRQKALEFRQEDKYTEYYRLYENAATMIRSQQV